MVATREHFAVEEPVRVTLASLPGARLGLVYGSAAVGRLGEGSDVDVAVAAHQPLSWDQRLDWAGRVCTALGREVDLLDLRSAHGLILREALCRGRLVLCRDRGLFAALIQRMLDEQEDFHPQLDRMLASRVARWTLR